MPTIDITHVDWTEVGPDLYLLCRESLEEFEELFPTFNDPPETTEEMARIILCAKLREALARVEGKE